MISEWLKLSAGFGAAFTAALTVSYALCRALAAYKSRRVRPFIGGRVRMRGENGVHRSRLEQVNESEWTLLAPLQRDNFVPMDPGEALIIEAPAHGGVLRFKSAVIRRDLQSKTVVIQGPKLAMPKERREELRKSDFPETRVLIDDNWATLLDLSSRGARILAGFPLEIGRRYQFKIPSRALEADVWVLGHESGQTRLRFETPIQLRSNGRGLGL